MKMNRTILSDNVIVFTYCNAFDFIKAFFRTLKYRNVKAKLNLMVSDKSVGAVDVSIIQKFKFIRAGE